MADKYKLNLSGAQIDDALLQMAERVPEGFAVGERDGVPVPSTSPYYHNNAKYYAQAAEAAAEAAEDAAEQAIAVVGVEPAAETPLVAGTGAVGTSGKYAREDHVHPAESPSWLNRSTAVNAADTNYTTLMARGISLHDTETTPSVNGAIAFQYG